MGLRVFVLDIIPILAGITAFFLAILVFTGSTRNLDRFTFTIFALSMGIWSVLVGYFLLTPYRMIGEIIVPIYYIAALFLIYGLLLFAYEFTTGKLLRLKNFVFIAIVSFIPIALMSYLIALPGIVVEKITLGPRHSVSLVTAVYALYCILFIFYGFVVLFMLLRNRINRTSAQRRSQHSIISWTISSCLPVAALFNLILPLYGNYDFIVVGPILTLPVVVAFFYAIMKHQLFDIRLALVRTVTYILSLGTMAAIYFFVAYLISGVIFEQQTEPSQNIINIILALALAFIFQPIRRFFDHLTNRAFYRNNYDRDEFFGRLNHILGQTTDLKTLLEKSSEEIKKTIGSEQVFFSIKIENDHFLSAGSVHHSILPRKDEQALEDYFKTQDKIVILVDSLSKEHSIYRLMVSHKLEIVMQLKQEDYTLGFLCLGNYSTHRYNQKDIKVLDTISNELVIAIENAISIQTVRDLNDSLKQRIEVATKELRKSNAQLQKMDETKDEFISMASHQLRTPLTSVKGYISMVLEGDAGKVTKMQTQLLDEAFSSSERMVHLINDFLNVSRIQTGKFVLERKAVNLATLVEEELSGLRTEAKSKGIEFVYIKPKHFPELSLDEGKMRQVVMNFADNAIYYSHENSKVRVKLSINDQAAELRITDTGIGIPENEKANLFTKFFRATNARRQRPDGTGVGLFLAKKVVLDHGGSVIFSSEEDEGSTFGFSLPFESDTLAKDVNKL